MGCFVVAGFLLTDASSGPSAIAELLVLLEHGYTDVHTKSQIPLMVYHADGRSG